MGWQSSLFVLVLALGWSLKKWYNNGIVMEDIDFEWDEARSQTNQDKHGIDFITAQCLWEDPANLIVALDFPHEPRWALIGLLDHAYWAAIFTWRGHRIRIISVRRARDKEIDLYEESNDTPWGSIPS